MLYEAADAEDKAKMDDYAEFCAYLAEREAMDEEELDEEGYFIDKMETICSIWIFFRFADRWGLTSTSEMGVGGKRLALICQKGSEHHPACKSGT